MANPEAQFGGILNQFTLRVSIKDLSAEDRRRLAEHVIRDVLGFPEYLHSLRQPEYTEKVWASIKSLLDAID